MSIRKIKSRGIGRLELLEWLNTFLEMDYAKIEHLQDGIAYCQILDALYPGKVSLHQVNFNAKNEDDFYNNMKLLKKALKSCGIQKEIHLRKLTTGTFQEHFEFLQWFHDYVNRTYPDALLTYDAYNARQQAQGNHEEQNSNLFGHVLNSNLVPRLSIRPGAMKTYQQEHIKDPFFMYPSSSSSPKLNSTKTCLNPQLLPSSSLPFPFPPPVPISDITMHTPVSSLMFPPIPLAIRESFESTIQAKKKLIQLNTLFRQIQPQKNKKKSNLTRNSIIPEWKGWKSMQIPDKSAMNNIFNKGMNTLTSLAALLDKELDLRTIDLEMLFKEVKSCQHQRDELLNALEAIEKYCMELPCPESEDLLEILHETPSDFAIEKVEE